MNENRTVVITGGAKGIGAEISRVFFEAGYTVIIGAREDNGFAQTLGPRARFFQTDVTVPTDLDRLARCAVDTTGRLDVMVNNAGFSSWRPLMHIDEKFWDNMIDTNLKGVLFGCKAAARHLPSDGSIVNVSSLAGKRGSANNSVYCASKFGVNGITQALAKELGPSGVRVNAVCPVYVRTTGVLAALKIQDSPTSGSPVEDYLEQFALTQTALRRLPEGREIGGACLFLSSPQASAITGQCINVDCGVMPQ